MEIFDFVRLSATVDFTWNSSNYFPMNSAGWLRCLHWHKKFLSLQEHPFDFAFVPIAYNSCSIYDHGYSRLFKKYNFWVPKLFEYFHLLWIFILATWYNNWSLRFPFIKIMSELSIIILGDNDTSPQFLFRLYSYSPSQHCFRQSNTKGYRWLIISVARIACTRPRSINSNFLIILIEDI